MQRIVANFYLTMLVACNSKPFRAEKRENIFFSFVMGKLLPHICKINYVNIQPIYVNMQINNVNMQQNYDDMQHNYVKMQYNYVNMHLEL